MSISYIPVSTQVRLWGKAGGRCQYDGCNDRLWLDALTQAEFNSAYIAHIVADSVDGPRGDADLSPLLGSQLSNLMILCDRHHRLIDKIQVAEHPVERLHQMKRKHEDRVELVCSLTEEKQSHVLLYGANIGSQSTPVSMVKAVPAMLPDWYPAESRPVEIGLHNSMLTDRDEEYWYVEQANLRAQFSQHVRPLLVNGAIKHLSIFAMAPQPLLIALGALISDIQAAEVYQLHREPPDWKWRDDSELPEFKVSEPDDKMGSPALVFSLSANVNESRVLSVLPDASIWHVAIDQPSNDFLKSRQQTSDFRVLMRSLMNRIKAAHGQSTLLHVFPAMPLALAVEFGRIRMPKADLPLCIYDQTREMGFQPALNVGFP
jgi:hypothetical protein